MPTKKATHQLTKQHNRDLVLKTIFDHQTISRAAIARMTKLTRATVSDMVNTLLEEGLVEEVGYGSPVGGKSPILLSLVADSRYLIGLNLGQDNFIGAVVNLRGEVKEMVEAPASEGDGQHAIQLVYQILDQLLTKEWTPIVGIGVGTPGLVNTREGVVLNAVNLDWQNLPLAQQLKERYGLPVSVVNDSQAAAVGEFVYGDDHRSDGNLIVINVRHGIGAGILINGRIFQGDGGGAGEIGHVVVQKDGDLCRCGNRGCLETVASASAILRRARTLLPEYPESELANGSQQVTLDAVNRAFQAGDPLGRLLVLDAAESLGASVGSLVGTLNIQRIVLTGDVTRFGEPWLAGIQAAMRQTALKRMAQETSLEIGKLEYRDCILGASALMLLDGYSLLFRKTND